VNSKIYYLARSYSPYQKGGGPLMRNGAVKYLKELGWNVTVVMPNYASDKLNIKDNIIQIPLNYNIKLNLYMERLGLKEDYLDNWINETFKYLKDKITKDDIVFATSGGELGMIKLGSLLKKEVNCKFVVNFRDPLNYGYMNGLRRDRKFHIGRVKAHEKYIKNADLILTSSQYYADVLENRFISLKDRIKNNYFGYIEKINIETYSKKDSKVIKIAYVGSMAKTQSPELLYKAWKSLNDRNIEIYFIGNIKNYKPLKGINEYGVHFIDFMPHHEFLEFMCENIDIGFVSLVNDYFGACVPSKIYEYINLGLPMIGALPDGDGKDIINNFGYGIASKYNDIKSISDSIIKMKNRDYLLKCKNKILNDKDNWSMQNKIIEVDKLLRELKK